MGFDYVPRLTDVGMRGSRYYSVVPSPWNAHIVPLNYFPHDGHPGNCTSYCIGRWWEICGGDTSKMDGLLSERSITGTWNGGAWYVCSPRLKAGTRSPQPGDIACWKKNDNYEGHVAVVEEVHLDYCVMSQSEYGRSGQYFRKTTNYAKYDYTGERPNNYYKANGYVLQGFIRMKDVPSPPSIPDFDMPTEWVAKPNLYDMTDADKENNAVMAAVQLYSYGWTLEAIAGALGNFQRESNIDPQSVGTGGCGLVGWTPPRIYTTWANHYGYTWYDGEKQIEFIDANIFVDKDIPYLGDGSLNLHPQWIAKPAFGNITYAEYKTMTLTPEEMAEIFMRGYERPGEPALEERKANARRWYDFLQGMNFESAKKPYDEHMPVWMLAGSAKPKLIY